jgi:biotin synthase-related radical SAM superfamily protein
MLFENVCPGKTKSYSRERMISALEYAAKVFKNGTYTTFVGGLEPLETMFEGWDYLASKGIAPALSVFHPLPDSAFYDKPAPTIDYLFAAVQKEHEIYQKYNFKGLLCKSCNRNALDNEAVEGYFQ